MESKKGISLVVLVITIIIMIILASSIIISLDNSNIINAANRAVELTNLKQVEHIASLAWAEAYMNGKTSQEQLQKAVDKALEDNKIDATKYSIVVTNKGVVVSLPVEAPPPPELNPFITYFDVALGAYATSAQYYEQLRAYPVGLVGGTEWANKNGGIKEINFYSKVSGESDDKYLPTSISIYPDGTECTSLSGELLLGSSMTYILFTQLDVDASNVLKVEYVYNDGSILYTISEPTEIVCFVAGTKVWTELGLLNIQDIKEGMKVYSKNMETGENELKEVLATSKRTLKTSTYKIGFDGEHIESTENHPFYVKGEGFVEASELKIGDILVDSENDEHIIDNIQVINNLESVTVYNMSIQGNHNYYVGENMILVHNASCPN